MTMIDICKKTTPQQLYYDEGFVSLEEIVKNLEIERTECMMGGIDGRKQKTYDKWYPIWKSYFNQVLPNHINDSFYMNPVQVKSYLERI